MADLTTLAAVREFLQKATADTGQDNVIESLITRASAVIQRYAEREFAPTSAVRKFRAAGRRVDLRPYDLRTATQVQLDTDTASPTVVASTEYRLEPFPARDDVYSVLVLQTAGASAWGSREVEITGSWGFNSVPDDVAHACIVTVVDWLRGDVAAFSSLFNPESGRVEMARIIPDEAKLVIDLYKRPLVA